MMDSQQYLEFMIAVTYTSFQGSIPVRLIRICLEYAAHIGQWHTVPSLMIEQAHNSLFSGYSVIQVLGILDALKAAYSMDKTTRFMGVDHVTPILLKNAEAKSDIKAGQTVSWGKEIKAVKVIDVKATRIE